MSAAVELLVLRFRGCALFVVVCSVSLSPPFARLLFRLGCVGFASAALRLRVGCGTGEPASVMVAFESDAWSLLLLLVVAAAADRVTLLVIIGE